MKRKRTVKVKLEFEPRDMWIGLYWNTYKPKCGHQYDFYICIVPMLPIHIRYTIYLPSFIQAQQAHYEHLDTLARNRELLRGDGTGEI